VLRVDRDGLLVDRGGRLGAAGAQRAGRLRQGRAAKSGAKRRSPWEPLPLRYLAPARVVPDQLAAQCITNMRSLSSQFVMRRMHLTPLSQLL